MQADDADVLVTALRQRRVLRSRNKYGLPIDQQQFRNNVDVLRSRLAPYDWNYAAVDEG